MTTARETAAEELRVLVHALDQAGDVLDHVHADHLDRPTPCGDWDVAALADHLVATPARFLAMMRGEQVDWSTTPHVRESWGPEFRVHGDDLLHAWHEHDGDPPTALEWQVAELATHTWDLAVAIGWPVDRLDPEVAETGLGYLRDHLEPQVRGEAFGPEQEAGEDAGPYERLAAFTGRTT